MRPVKYDILFAPIRIRRNKMMRIVADTGKPDFQAAHCDVHNRASPPSVLGVLAGDCYALNRVVVAGHCGLAVALAEGLLEDPEPQVRFAAAARLARAASIQEHKWSN